MTTNIPSQPTTTLVIDQAFQQAIAHHQAGRLQEAGELYRAILQADPNHPEANHHMGVLAVQMKQPAAGLPYFMAALDADPARGQYWLNYIDALFQAGQLEDARQVLALARQQGLEGGEVEALVLRLEGGAKVAEKSNAEGQQASSELPLISSAVPQNSQKPSKTKPAGKLAPPKGKTPSTQEINTLVGLFNQGRYTEAATLAQEMTVRFPLHWVGWKMLGVVLQQMGRSADVLVPMQKAAALSPNDAEAHNNLGTTLQNLGRLDEAEASYRRALQINPDYAQAHSNLGATLQNMSRLIEAEASYRRALQINPDYAKAHSNLGATYHDLGRLNEAEASYRRALQIKPDYAEAHYNLGVTLQNLGRLDEAENSYRRALQINPDYAEAHSNLGTTHHDLGRFDEAEASYQRALQINPDYAEAHSNLGAALKELSRLDESETSLRRALQIKPDYAPAHINLGALLHDLGRLDEAENSYRRALQINQNFAGAHYNLGNTLKYLGRLDEAEASYRRALQIKPDFAEAYNNLGVTLQKLGRMDESEDSLRRALQIKPDYAEAHSNLGITLLDMGRLAESEVSLRRALQIKPDLAEAHNNLGNILKDMGRLDEAETSYRRALQIKPDYAQAYSNLLFLHGYHALIDPQEYLAQARNWEQACVPAQDRQAARHRIFQRPPLAGRRLRVGYVSGDYHQHAVSYFIEQIFAYHDKAQIELFLYSTNGKRDAVTERLQALAEHWVPLSGIPDAAIRERIEADAIDVLIDLSGHTKHHRMGVFARRAAPVQAHYLGFFASTGLTEMDYWIGDEVLTPAGTDSHFSERVWRLPRVWVSYDGKADAPVSAWQPGRDGVVWLGSFNNLGKLTPATLALWAKVLHALPEGKLLLKTKELADAGNRQRILDVMAGHGITPGRIELQDRSATPDWSAHMAYYDRLDIALDPVGGLGGGTTTCDALWMGVPVITLEGDRMASRMTASMLDAIGHPEWIARSEAEYIDKVAALARDVEQRKVLRSGQRNRMAASPLCDAHGLAMALENAYFEMFERWSDEKN